MQCSVPQLSSGVAAYVCSRRLNSRMHKDARKSRNFRQGESTETVCLNSAAQSNAKRRHFILCELSRLSLELNATHIHIFESVYKRARNIACGPLRCTKKLYACGNMASGPFELT